MNCSVNINFEYFENIISDKLVQTFMYALSKAFILIIIFMTFIWLLFGYIFFIYFIENIEQNIPFMYIVILLIVGYVITIGIGISIIYEKILWKHY